MEGRKRKKSKKYSRKAKKNIQSGNGLQLGVFLSVGCSMEMFSPSCLLYIITHS